MINTIKYKVMLVLLAITLGLGGTLYLQHKELEKTKEMYSVSRNNEKALGRDMEKYVDMYGREHTRNIQLISKTKDLKHSTHSLDKYILNKAKESKIKSKNITQTGVVVTGVDTTLRAKTKIGFPDTTIDLSDPHVTNIISFKDSVLTSKVAINDTLSMIYNKKRETIKPPKKFFIARWVQKRHTLVMVEVTHSNPRVTTKTQRFILTE